eukprot:CAMPEP_0170741554 /NCGR_PEP_ID=MMETSP0437-20130122/6283_1 /TAXON_ID=0 /ORGANISM="Sexangularia sp." /LENGTH=40 /DNA_ID= /DNA_START= /DNA_END= /DNA_ORIENTATION=
MDTSTFRKKLANSLFVAVDMESSAIVLQIVPWLSRNAVTD